MSLPVIWTSPARAHLYKLHEYISESNPSAADRQVSLLVHAAERLGQFPELGRVGRHSGTGEPVVSGTPYIVACRLRLASVRILAVVHGAQRWPRSFGS